MATILKDGITRTNLWIAQCNCCQAILENKTELFTGVAKDLATTPGIDTIVQDCDYCGAIANVCFNLQTSTTGKYLLAQVNNSPNIVATFSFE